MNTILTNTVSVEGSHIPESPTEEPAMADEAIFPRWYYAASTPAGRVFDTQAALDAASAEGPWFTTPTEAAEAAAKAPASTTPAPEDEPEEHPTRRSHR